MARGKPLNISHVKKIIVGELLGSTHAEIAQGLDLHPQTIDRVTRRDDYHRIKKHLADSLMHLSTSELLRI